jgi:predicted permease
VRADVEAEIEFHLDQLTEELMGNGLSEKEARADAGRMFGNLENARSECFRLSLRRSKRVAYRYVVSGFYQDVKYVLRSLRKRRLATAVVVLTLALGIGANTAVFSVYHSVLLDPFPYENPEQLVQVWEANPEANARGQLAYTDLGVNPLNYIDYRDQSSVFSNMGYVVDYAEDGTITVGEDGDVTGRVGVWSVSSTLFDVLGVSPFLGRPFLESERAPANDRTGRWIDVVILSHELWHTRFLSDTGIVGRKIEVDGAVATVVGVMPPGFQLPPLSQWGSVEYHDADVYLPLHYPAFEMGRRFHQFRVIARLKQGVSVEQAGVELGTIAERLEREYPETNTGWKAEVSALRSTLSRDFGNELKLLMGAAGLVLLIACANVASLQLALGITRSKEIATRAALGAGRFGIIRHLLAESMLLAAFGGLAGLLVTFWVTQYLVAFVPGDLPRAPEAGIALPVFGFTVLLSLFAGLVFGLAPTVTASQTSLVSALKEGGRPESPEAKRWRISKLLLPGQVAFTVVLLIGSGLLLKSFGRLSNTERGYDSSDVLVARVFVGDHHPVLGTAMPGHPEYEARKRAQTVLFRDVLDRVRALPGVVDATTTASLPLQGGVGFLPLQIEGSTEEGRHTRRAEIGPNYFRTMGIPLIRGKVLWERGQSQADAGAAVVSQTLALTQWPGEDPVGKRFGFWDCCDLTVVGVVGDVDDRGVDDPPFNALVDPRAVVYTPRLGGDLLVRTTIGQTSVADEVRAVYSDLLSGFVLEFDTLDGLHSSSLSRPRFYLLLVGVFAAVALALAAVDRRQVFFVISDN